MHPSHRLSRRELLCTLSAAGAPWLARIASGATVDVASMRIARYEILQARVPFADRLREAWNASWKNQKRDQTDYDLVFVRLYSDNGLMGLGEAKMKRTEAEAILKKMIGRSPWEYAQDDQLRGIMIAVYDLLGKATGLPVSRLLSPHPKREIIQTWWSQCFPPDLMASEAKMGAALGYRVHKIKIRPWQDPVEQAAAIGAVVPPDFKIWADANAWWGADNRWEDRSRWAKSVDGAVHVLRKLAAVPNIFGIESPFGRQELTAYRQLRRKIQFRMAEHIDGADPMVYIREELLDAFITGSPRLGTYFTELAAVGKATGVPLWVEHSIDNGIAQVFQAHQSAAFSGVEYCISITHCLADDCMLEPFTMENGFYKLPQKPGLGVTLDEKAVDKYRTA